jgi:hypothetical protein
VRKQILLINVQYSGKHFLPERPVPVKMCWVISFLFDIGRDEGEGEKKVERPPLIFSF